MNASKPFPIILHVRVPSILRGCDQQRYLERKLRDFDLRLRPSLKLAGTDHDIGYGLVCPGMGGWNVIEVRGELPTRLNIIDLHQHPLVEDVMDEALEKERQAKLAAEWEARPRVEDYGDDENTTAGGPMPGPRTMSALKVGLFILTPLTLAARGLQAIRCWYVREHG